MDIALNSGLAVDDLAARYAEAGRMQVRDLLQPDSAEAIHERLKALEWGLAFNEGAKVHQFTMQQMNAMSAEQRQNIARMVHRNAVTGYQFLYNYYPLFENYFKGKRGGIDLFAEYEFINSAPFLDFVRRLTGRTEIRWADAHATLFRAGHFLKYHTDEKPSDKRVAAYVMNFTKDWGRDWGGYLQFFDEKYDVELAFRPIFNALNIFTIPADHSVSVVAPYAPGLRFSITGWMRADEPPGPISAA